MALEILYIQKQYCKPNNWRFIAHQARIVIAPACTRSNHFQSNKIVEKEHLLKTKLSLDFVYNLQKKFVSSDKNPDYNIKPRRQVPKLILLQNPFTWLMTKIDFQCLKSVWDPSFRESEFKFGTRQAISRVSQVISEGHYEDLNGLLTKAARLSLLRELDRNWSPRQRALLALHRDDIQVSSPRKVHFIRIANKKFCDVDMTFLALKWALIQNIDTLLLAEIFARFHREYTPSTIPEWTIAYFKVTRFEALRRRSRSR